MVAGIGRSTHPSTAGFQQDISGSEPASFRYNNPGAQYPSADAARFGQTGFGIIGGGHKIARFPSPVNGAASNFDLLFRKYTGMTIGAAGEKWTGAHGFGVPGYDPKATLTTTMLEDPVTAIALLKAIAGRESGRGNNLTEQQWTQAHQMFRAGSADAFLGNLPAETQPPVVAGSKSGAGLLKRALEHIGEKYENALAAVPKDDPNWKGPWDCAEFVSWLVYQEAGILYGCTDDKASPSKAEAYTGAWKTDVERLGKRVSVEEAAGTVGGIVLRYPPGPGLKGHIAVCDGKGGTVEAKSERYGVIADTVSGRQWHTGILIPGITYGAGSSIQVISPASIYEPSAPNMDKAIVAAIQTALTAKGFNPGTIDGDYGPDTQAAVAAFQKAEGLVIDGAVGPETAAALGVSLTGQTQTPSDMGTGQSEVLAGLPAQLLALILANLAKEKTMAEETAKPAQVIDPAQLLLPLLQSLLSGKPIDTAALIAALQNSKTAETPATPPTGSTTQSDQLTKFAEIIALLIARKDGPVPPGPVNNALGPAIGNMLNGRKTAIGAIGALLTSILSVPGISGTISSAIPALAATPIAPIALPIFLALTGWGVLGKMEKWTKEIEKKS